jgi:hypothetical protein
MPPAKKKFHISFFQSYLKKVIPAGKHAAQAWRRLADIPKCLLPSNKSAGTIRPIRIPATYHGQGFCNTWIINHEFKKQYPCLHGE